MTTTFYPTFRYHPTEAPQGRKFTEKAEFLSLGPEWVDTPDKFPVLVEALPEPVAPDAEAEPKRRGRKPKAEESVQ